MLKKIILLLLVVVSAQAYSQKYLDIVAEKSCDCATKVTEDIKTQEGLLKFGMCIYDATMPYKKNFKKDHHINMDKFDEEQGRKLGTLVAVRMANFCPDFLVKLGQAYNEGNAEEAVPAADTAAAYEEVAVEPNPTATGTITKIEGTQFIAFTLKESNGTIATYYWLYAINSPEKFETTYLSKLNKAATIEYFEQEFFDAKTKTYKLFRVIASISF